MLPPLWKWRPDGKDETTLSCTTSWILPRREKKKKKKEKKKKKREREREFWRISHRILLPKAGLKEPLKPG